MPKCCSACFDNNEVSSLFYFNKVFHSLKQQCDGNNIINNN